MELSKKIKKLTEVSSKLGEIGLIVIEDEKKKHVLSNELIKSLNVAGFGRAMDYMECMDLLEKSQPFYYLENGAKLDDLILELIAEFKTGIISLMDRKYKLGLKTVKFNPNNNSIIIILTRDQVESSGNFFKFIGPMESLK